MTGASSRSRALATVHRHPLLLSAFLALLTCPFMPATPSAHLDRSWGFALHAWVSGSAGSVPVTYFTYGPLGFLTVPVVWGRTTYALALLFALLVQVALCRVLLARAVRVAPLPVAVVTTLLLAALAPTQPAELLVFVEALVAAELLQAGVAHRRAWLLGGSAVAGLALLVKFSTGVVSTVLLVVVAAALAGPGWRRRLGTAGGAGLLALGISAAAFGVVTGHPGAFPTWLRASKEIAGGYTAMAYELGGGTTTADYAFAVPLLLALLTVAAGLAWRTRAVPQVAGGAVMAVVLYLAFREGFTRHDSQHVEVFVAALLLLPFGLALGRTGRWLLAPLVAATLAFGVWQTHVTDPGSRYDLAGNVGRLADRLQLVADARAVQDTGRAAMRSEFQVPREVQDALRGHRVQVDPYDTGVAWAYGLRWGPSSVWALYSAYTPWLDEHNAASLAPPDGPDRILRRTGGWAVDARQPAFDSPRYQLTELCRWRQFVRSGAWQVLERGPDRCAAPTVLGTARLTPGVSVKVPPARTPGAVVTVRLRLDQPWDYRLESALFKPSRPQYVTLDGVPYRLVVATAGGPLVLSAPSDPSFPAGTATLRVDLPGTAVFEERAVSP